MNLKTRVAEFNERIVNMEAEFVEPFDVNDAVMAVERRQESIQFMITRARRQIPFDKVS
jgi:hypothetical protein